MPVQALYSASTPVAGRIVAEAADAHNTIISITSSSFFMCILLPGLLLL